MIELLTDDELDLAIDAARRELARLRKIRGRRRSAKTLASPGRAPRKYSDEFRRAQSLAQKGKKRSPEACARIAAGIRKAHAHRRAVKGLSL